MPNFTH